MPTTEEKKIQKPRRRYNWKNDYNRMCFIAGLTAHELAKVIQGDRLDHSTSESLKYFARRLAGGDVTDIAYIASDEFYRDYKLDKGW